MGDVWFDCSGYTVPWRVGGSIVAPDCMSLLDGMGCVASKPRRLGDGGYRMGRRQLKDGTRLCGRDGGDVVFRGV